MRVLGYYESAHPIFVQARGEVRAQLERAHHAVIGCAGSQLIAGEDGATLDDEPAAAIAERMFKASIICIRMSHGASERDLEALLALLAESAERVRDAGGAAAIFEPEDPRTISLLAVDFGALFAGHIADLRPLTAGEPIAELALERLLRHGPGEAGAGEAVEVGLDQLGTVESLGDFLDDLIGRAEPSVLAKGVAREPPDERAQLISGDELADLAVRAYTVNQRALGGNSDQLAESARVLSDALVRLSPAARFALLRRLAGADEDTEPGELAAVERLGAKMPDKAIVEAVAAALVEHKSDSDAVRAIGNLIRRVRPVEADRERILGLVDREMAVHHTRIDGLLWQEMRARALEKSSLGMLELDLRERAEELAGFARARREGRIAAVAGDQILRGSSTLVIDKLAAQALADIARDRRVMAPALLEAARAVIEALDHGGEGEASLPLLRALMQRADDEGGGGACAALVRELLIGARGGERTARLARLPGGQTRMSGEILLRALDGPGDRGFKEQLLDRLAHFPPEVLHELAGDLTQADPHRISFLVRAALRADQKMGVKLARTALKNPHGRAKEAAIRALAEVPERESLGLLAGLAGWKGDRVSKLLLGDKKLHELQLLAIEMLGAARSPLAVGALTDMLNKKGLIATKASEEARLRAAQALAAIGTREAVAALEQGKSAKKKSVREAASRALSGSRKPL